MYLCKNIVLICELTFVIISLAEIVKVPKVDMQLKFLLFSSIMAQSFMSVKLYK